MDPTTRALQFANYTFDASLLEIFTTLILGGCVCVPNDEDRLNNIARVINDMNITWTLLTPSFVQLIQPSSIPKLRTLVLGGEAMSQSHISTWAAHLTTINAYGPTEAAVVATANSHISTTTDPANMGRAVGGRSWITDVTNPNRLVPIGSVGELLIEGPILAQGYLKNESKTAEVFIENPTWACKEIGAMSSTRRRLYRTGDMVKYAPDGSLIFCGRKDNQVKLHGQRMELSDVEHHLRVDPSVRHALAIIPRGGLCKDRLVAILSLQEVAATEALTSASGMQVVVREASSFYLPGIRGRLCENLPSYMIPSNWVVVEKLPLLPSGKLDRRQVEKWVEEMTAQLYHHISDIEHEELAEAGTTVEEQLREIWGNVLNLPFHQISLQHSFLHLGGDSISAMAVMARCRANGLGVTVQNIIQTKAISELALRVTLPEEISNAPEAFDELFDLSPIQSLFFQCVGEKYTHFNQSVMLRLAKFVEPEMIRLAIQTLAKSHSMLRAKFIKNELGIWQQRISRELSSSHLFQARTVTKEQVHAVIKDSQESLDIANGPLFAICVLNVEGQPAQLLSIVAHHLIIDIVSWKILLADLEDILFSGHLKFTNSLPFQTWSRLQLENAQHSTPRNSLLEEAPIADFSYWDMENKVNTYGDTTEDGFTIGTETSLILLGSCHEPLQTEPVDVFLAALLQSFQKVFSDRSEAPAIYNEGHGREPWAASKLDLSRTVGWFTTMCPIFLPTTLDTAPDFLDTIRWVKDLRRRIPDKGRPYFANRLLTSEGRQRFCKHWPMEITFNYLGRLQQLERTDSMLQSIENSSHADRDIGRDVPRFALFEISAAVTHGNIKFSFSYNKNMKRQAKIRRWVAECQRSLEDAAKSLIQLKPEKTLCNFPLLPLAFSGMSQLVATLPQLGVRTLDEIEDVYPCTPIQQGMLLAQLKNPDLYAYSAIFEAFSPNGQYIDARYLAEAWQLVVRRHSTLRTVFIDSICQEGRNDQVVLKDQIARIAWLECEDENVLRALKDQNRLNFRDLQPPHRFTLCKAPSGKIWCKIEISHIISDGTSIPILLKDLSTAYENCFSNDVNTTLPKAKLLANAPLYSDYLSHIQSTSSKEDINYWKAYLAGIEPCHLTSLHDGVKMDRELRSLVLVLSRTTELRSFCSQNGVTLSNVLQLVWALILRVYTGSDEVVFGYLTSGRDAPIEGLQSAAVGAFINMLTCRINLKESLPIQKALRQIQDDYMNSMAHQTCSLADIQHEIELSNTSLFNTAFTFQKRTMSGAFSDALVSFDILEAHDPSEYDVAVNVEALESGVEIHFGYWTTSVSDNQAKNIAQTFEHLLNTIISKREPEETVGTLDFVSEDSRRQIMKWNATLPTKVDRRIHDMIEDQSIGREGAKPAICGWDGNFTYEKLNQLATALALHLVELGVGPEVFVPLCFEKSCFNVISMLAVLKAGGSFVPLDFSHPEGRLKHFIDDVRAEIVLCSRQNLGKVTGAAKHVVVVDMDAIHSLKYTRETSILHQTTPDSAAYVIFTSGTTGRPKGTIISHTAFATSAIAHSKAMFMKPSSRVFQFASHTFDASVMEILTTLIVGGCVCIPSEEERMNDIPGAIKQMGVTWTLLTPSVASTLSPKSVPSLKVLVTGGEAMSAGHLKKWKGGGRASVNAYGPSETSGSW
jgi:non-ribosomal peptide synthase protein (TIGR01720 family)